MPYIQKQIITDTLIRVITYMNFVPSGYKANRDEELYQKAKTGEKRKSSINRAKDDLALTIAANVTKRSKFITLTVKDNILDREKFLQLFNTFRNNAKKYLGYKLEYVAVTETQKKRGKKNNDSGAWHIHMVVFNVPQKLDIADFNSKCWKYGNVNIKQVKQHWQLFKYLTKYLSKDELELNKKAVLKSRGLEQPTVITAYEAFDTKDLGSPDFHDTYLLYHGDLEKDKHNNVFDIEKVNQATIQEWHILK